jgi:hypothetical protein
MSDFNEVFSVPELARQNGIERDIEIALGTTTINISINNLEHVYASFSYLIIEWIKKTIFGGEYKGIMKACNENEITFPNGFSDLVFRIFDTDTIRHHDDTDNSSKTFTYTFDIFEEPIIFKYKEMTATIKIIKEKNALSIVKDFRGLSSLFGIVSINFYNKYQQVFNEVLDYASKSFDEHRENELYDPNYTCVYLSEETYWDLIQKKSKRSLDTIYLPDEDKRMLVNDVENFLKPETKKLYERFCITYKRVYLFEGVPGSGKSSFISALAAKFNYGLSVLNFHIKLDDNALMKLIKNLPKKTFLLLEDMDCLFESRKPSDSEKNGVSFSGLLNSLDGISTNHGFICFITTNYKNRLEPALIRPGRVDMIYKFDYATAEQIKNIYKAFMELSYTEEAFKTFNLKLQDLRIKISMSLLNQYLFAYINKPDEALKNIEKMKSYYKDSKISKEADDVEMYS